MFKLNGFFYSTLIFNNLYEEIIEIIHRKEKNLGYIINDTHVKYIYIYSVNHTSLLKYRYVLIGKVICYGTFGSQKVFIYLGIMIPEKFDY